MKKLTREWWLFAAIIGTPVILLLILLLLLSDVAVAFPENIRHGYQSCGSCHVSPAGGGVMTAYGRSTSNSFLSTWSAKDEEDPSPVIGNFPQPDVVQVGGDTRYINVNMRSQDGSRMHQKFLMQSDLEVAVQPIPGLTLDVSGGIYGPTEEVNYRRYYAKVAIGDHVAFRAGRFFPAYGIAVPDHTIPTRSKLWLGEGKETTNFEASVVGSYGEFFATGIYDGNEVHLNQDQGVSKPSDAPRGFAARGAVYLGSRAALGLSGMNVSSPSVKRQAYGLYGMWGITESIYLLAEADQRYDGITRDPVGMARIGWEPVKGLHWTIQHEYDGTTKANTPSTALTWYPRPHYELQAEYKRTLAQGERKWIDSGILMLHHYL